MKGRIVVEIEKIPEDCYSCGQTDEYGYCHWVGKYIDHCSKIGERYPTCPIEPWEGNDRDYKAGDVVTLKEWTGTEYTGNEITVGIKYVLKDCPEYGLMDGYCIFGW